MKDNYLEVKKYYVASVSGGKDSLYMLKVIFENINEYPLNEVVYFDLGYSNPFEAKTILLIQKMCLDLNIKFRTITPTYDFDYLNSKFGPPSATFRWCNSSLKMDCSFQLEKELEKMNYDVVWYIGFCANEEKRFKSNLNQIYPLAEKNIIESDILEWAKNQACFGIWYKNVKRMGCAFCPFVKYIEMAIYYKFAPSLYDKMLSLGSQYEELFNKPYFLNHTVTSSKMDYVIKKYYLDKIVL